MKLALSSTELMQESKVICCLAVFFTTANIPLNLPSAGYTFENRQTNSNNGQPQRTEIRIRGALRETLAKLA